MQAVEDIGPSDPGPTSSHASGRWILVGRIVSQASQLIVFIFAARLLTPSAFGLFALVAAISALLFTLGAAGWREVIISTTRDALDTSCALTMAILTSLTMSVVCVLSAAIVHFVWQDDQASLLTALFAITVLCSPIASALSGLLVRADRVPILVISGIIGEIAGFFFAIGLLIAGWGVFALLVGKIVQQIIVLVLTFLQSGWYGPLSLQSPIKVSIVRTSAHILANRIITFLQGNISTFAIGLFLGPAAVGFFRAADRIVSAVAELVTEPARMIAWLQFRATDDRPTTTSRARARFREEARASLTLLLTLTSPIFVGLALIADDLIEVVIGPNWGPAATVAELLALCGFAFIPSIIAEPIFSRLGCVEKLSRVLFFNAIVMIVFVSLAGKFGLISVAAAVLAASCVSFVTGMRVLIRETGNDWREVGADIVRVALPAFVLVVSASGAEWLSEANEIGSTLTVAVQIAIGGAAYLGLVYLLRPDLVRQLVKL